MSQRKAACWVVVAICLTQMLVLGAAASDLDDLVAYEARSNELAAAGKFRQAIEVATKMVRFAEQKFQQDPKYIGLAWNHLAGRLLEIEEFKPAEQAAQKALTIQRAQVGPNDGLVADALTNVANAHLGLNRHADALAGHQQALRIREITKGAMSTEVADTQENIGVVQADLGRHAEAEPYFRRALAIKTELTDGRDTGVAQLHYNLGHGYLEQRRFSLAEAHLKHSLKLYESLLGPEYWVIARVATHLGRVYRWTSNYAEAEKFARRGSELMLKLYGPDDPAVAGSHELADLFAVQKRYAEAEEIYLRALGYFEANPQQDQGNSAIVLDSLARVYAGQKRWDKSLAMSDRALEKLSGQESAAKLNHIYLRRGITRGELGRKDALDDFRKAIEYSETMRSTFSGDDSGRAESFVLFSHAYWEAAKYLQKQNDTAGAFRELERSRARSLIDQMNAAHVDLLAGLPVEQARTLHLAQAKAEIQLASLEQQWQELGSQASLGKAEQESARQELARLLMIARRDVAAAHTAIRTASPAYRRAVGKDFAPVELAELTTWLRQRKSLLLYYVDLPDDCYVLSIGSAAGTTYSPLVATAAQAQALGFEAGPVDHEKLKAALVANKDALLPKLADHKRAKDTTAQLAALWELLIPTADRAALLAGEYESLQIVSCASLLSLPFETLVTSAGEEPQYLLDSGPPILYAPSATILMNLASQKTTAAVVGRPPVLTVGDPAYSASSKISRLPFTATESHWVKEAYTKQGQLSTQLLTTASTEAAVRANIAGRRVVHLACHGSAQQDYGNLFGSLLLAPGQRGTAADDGSLTLGEIYSLDLRGCELAILSACQTNYGPQQLGEGGWALTRGFLAAGTRRVVSSNWVVDDKAAATLIYFFANEAAGSKENTVVDHALALQEAKRAIRKRAEWQSPFYWAPFVLVGPR